MKEAIVTVCNDTLSADLTRLIHALEPSDLAKIEGAAGRSDLTARGLYGLHAVMSQVFAPKPAPPADADLRAELEHQKQLNAKLCDRVHAQAEMLARRAEAAAEPSIAAQVERIERLVRAHDDTIGGLQEYHDDKGAAVVVDTAHGGINAALATAVEPAPAPVEPGAVAIRAEPSSNGHPERVLAGSAKARSELGRANRLAIARSLASGPQSVKCVAAATGLVYGTVAGIFGAHDTLPAWFVKTEDRHGAPYQLTDAGRAALGADGFVLVPQSMPAPAPKAEAEPEAEPEAEEDAAPVSVQELARRQALAIARAIFDAETPEISRARIEAVTGLSESVVKQRLMAGSNALGLPAARFFAKRNDGWSLTHVGVALVKEKP